MKKDATVILYYDRVNTQFYITINQGSSWYTIDSPIDSSLAALYNDFVNNDIYFSCINQKNIYKLNKDADAWNLVRTVDVSIQSFLPSQYGRGAVFTEAGSKDLYYAKNYQTYIKVYDGSVSYPMVL